MEKIRILLHWRLRQRDAVVQVFFVRGGRLIGREHFYMTHVSQTPEGTDPADFVKQFYAGTPFVPREIMLQTDIEDREVIEEWLTGRRGSRVYLRVPKIGSKEKLVELAARNAELILSKDKERIRREEGRTIGAVKEIASLLVPFEYIPYGGLRYFQHQWLCECRFHGGVRKGKTQTQRLS